MSSYAIHPIHLAIALTLYHDSNGTMGMMNALEILGYKPYHMKTVFETGASHLNVLNDVIRAKYHGEGKVYGKEEFDRWFADYDVSLLCPGPPPYPFLSFILLHYLSTRSPPAIVPVRQLKLTQAILDVTSFFAPELVAAYPDAKFILTTRDPQRWVRSVNSTMLKMTNIVSSFPIRHMGCMSEFLAAWVEFAGLAPRHIWKNQKPGTDEEAIKTYNAQYVHLDESLTKT